MSLFIRIIDNNLETLYKNRLNHNSDCGFDLYINSSESIITIPANARGYKIYTGIMCSPSGRFGYYLYPRSSIIKTPLRLANSVGIIDPEYRGEIIAAVDNLSSEDVILGRDKSLFQLCLPTLAPFEVQFVEELSETIRGSGGFGSTH